MSGKVSLIIMATAIVLCTSISPAYAYLDPGTGSIMIQSVIGAIAAIGVTLKLYWHKIKIMFSRRKVDNIELSKSENSVPED